MKIFILMTIIVLMSGVVFGNIVYADWFDDYKKKENIIYYPSAVEKIVKKFPALQVFDNYIHWSSGIRFFKAKDRKSNQKYFLWCGKDVFGEEYWYLGKAKCWDESGVREMFRDGRETADIMRIRVND